MSDQITVKKWSYPFRAVGEPTKEVTDPQVYFDALAKAANGFHPMGSNGLWHGGVHFDEHTATLLDQSSVRCIADGEVVAYRIDKSYRKTDYEGLKGAPYSTGFVLVRHRLELPPAPGSDSSKGSPTAAAEPGCLTFFSLYMHLLEWPGYTANPTLERPAFWGEGCYTVKADAPNQVLGLNVREHHKVASTDERYAQYQNKLATLPRGTRIKTGEAAPSPYQGWRKLVRATPSVKGLADNTGWVYVPEAKKLAEHEYLIAEAHSRDVPAVETRGLHVRAAASSGSDVLAVLPRGAQVRVSHDGATGGYVKLLEACESAVPPLSADASGKVPGFVWLDSLEPTCEPNESAMDAVYVLPQPQRIDAGALIGHLGIYQDYDQASPSPRLHLEVFSCEDVPAFIAKSRARAATLPESDKTLIKVHKGSAIIQPTAADTQIEAGSDVRVCSDSPEEGCWAKVQKYATCNAEKSTELGSFDSGKLTYSLSAAQKSTLATRMGVEAADMPDKVDFLKVYFNSAEGGDPQNYTGGNIPSTHTWRKVGAPVGDPVWVERSKLNAQGQRSSTAGALSAWTQFPLQSSSDGAISGYDRILPAGSWDGLAHERKAIDHANVRWWHVTVGDATGQDISGWVPEKDLIVTRHSPWEWPGFSTIQEAATPADLHARALQAEGRTTPEEATQLQGRVDAAERGPILQKLYEIIDQSNETGTRDGLLTTKEFKAALGKPWLAQQLSLLIAQYESEWFPNDAKWKDLDAHMADDLAEWEKEKGRIKELTWWGEVTVKHELLESGITWHFHPIGLTATFSCSEAQLITLEMLQITKPSNDTSYYEEALPYLNEYARAYEVNTPLRIAHFLAQVGHESGFKVCSEGGNYSGKRMREIFGCIGGKNNYSEDTDECSAGRLRNKLWTEESAYAHNPKKLLSYVYASRLGNGDEASEEGYKYRGRGIIQLTGKNNYRKYTQIHNQANPNDQKDFVENPDLITSVTRYGIESAFVYWAMVDANSIADKDDAQALSIAVNGGLNGYDDRLECLDKLKKLLGI